MVNLVTWSLLFSRANAPTQEKIIQNNKKDFIVLAIFNSDLLSLGAENLELK